MNRSRRLLVVPALLLLGLALLACGPKPQPTAPSAPQATEVPRPTAGPTALPEPTEPAGPPSSLADVPQAYENIQKLPGYHAESLLRGQKADGSPSYIRTVRDVDAAGNFHLVVWSEADDTPAFEMYYVNQHVYLGQGGQFMDLGEQPLEQAAGFYQLYDLPFTMLLLGAANLQPVGHETVGGLACTKYRASFDQWVKLYLQARAGATYTAEGYLWISDQYGAIIKSTVQATLIEEGQTSSFSAETEISQVGQVGSIRVP